MNSSDGQKVDFSWLAVGLAVVLIIFIIGGLCNGGK